MPRAVLRGTLCDVRSRKLSSSAGVATLIVAFLGMLTASSSVAVSAVAPLERIDINNAGKPADVLGLLPSLSADGRFVAFSSSAGNLVPGDINPMMEERDVFVRDRATSSTARVSVAKDGSPGAHGESDTPSISADGRFVAFVSSATNLVAGDTNGFSDVFVHDRARHTTSRVSVRSDGAQANRGGWAYPAISADGRFVAFASSSSNLAPATADNSTSIFVHDRHTGRTIAASNASNRTFDDSPAISAHGRFVAFERFNGKTTSVLVRDRKARRTTRADLSSSELPANASSSAPSISANGRYVAFTSDASNLVRGDTNRGPDVFVRDLRRGRTTRASIRADGTPVPRCPRADEDGILLVLPCGAEPALSASGRFIAFTSASRRFARPRSVGPRGGGVFLRDLRRHKTTTIDTGDIDSPAISADGRFVAFESWTRGGLFLSGPLR